MATWISDIVTALTNLGGAASYDGIYEEIKRVRGSLPNSWRKIIQREIQSHASESSGFNGTPLFYSINGKGSGTWGLLKTPNDKLDVQGSSIELSDSQKGSRAAGEDSNRRRNRAWSRDELILALHLYLEHRISPPGKDSVEVIKLSEFLNEMRTALGIDGSATYRNANGVYMKLMNFRRFDPHYIADGKVGLTRGNKDEELVWNEFSDDLDRLTQVVKSIRFAVKNGSSLLVGSDDDSEIVEAEEGRVLTKIHRVRERNRRLIEQRKNMALKTQGCLFCEACGFDFSITYGKIGQGLIEVHHTKPVHTLKEGDKTRLEDLALLCANCHRVVHSSRRWLTIDQLKAAIKNA